MNDFRRKLENISVLLVLVLSAPLAALLVAVLLIYFYILAIPGAPGETESLRDLFAMIYVAVYLTICFWAVKGA
tara:strand:+ start:1337 stop:1558 length:222 start_codon:yes stop_codon:yes gene_type:complete